MNGRWLRRDMWRQIGPSGYTPREPIPPNTPMPTGSAVIMSNPEFYQRRGMSLHEGETGFPAASLNSGEKTAERPTEHELLSEAKAAPGTPQKARGRAQTRTLQAKVEFIVGLADEDGLPALAVPVQEVTIGLRDPQGHGRDMVQQFADLKATAEQQVLKQWEEANAAAR